MGNCKNSNIIIQGESNYILYKIFMKFFFAVLVGKILIWLTHLVSKERGTNLPGAWALKIDKKIIEKFKNIDYNKVIFITGTNGKSTSNNLIAQGLRSAGKTVAVNLDGANLVGGIATTLIKYSTLSGKIKTEYVVLEVDERSFAKIHSMLPGKIMCITNLQKDQVQRNGEPDYVVQKLRKVVTPDMTLFLNNDEPRTKAFEDLTNNVFYYGVAENAASFKKNGFYDVTMPCPKCNDKLEFDYYNIDNVGQYHCVKCGFRNKANPDFKVSSIDYEDNEMVCNGVRYKIPYNKPHFIYNYVLFVAIATYFGMKVEEIQKGLESFVNIAGRYEKFYYGEKEITYLRIKQENPETLQSTLDGIAHDKSNKIVVMGIGQLEDFIPYYTNTFYTYDCNIDKLEDSNVEKYISYGKAIAYDQANRFIYEGISESKIKIIPSDDMELVLDELDKSKCNNVYLVAMIHKYEEFREIAEKRKQPSKAESKK